MNNDVENFNSSTPYIAENTQWQSQCTVAQRHIVAPVTAIISKIDFYGECDAVIQKCEPAYDLDTRGCHLFPDYIQN